MKQMWDNYETSGNVPCLSQSSDNFHQFSQGQTPMSHLAQQMDGPAPLRTLRQGRQERHVAVAAPLNCAVRGSLGKAMENL